MQEMAQIQSTGLRSLSHGGQSRAALEGGEDVIQGARERLDITVVDRAGVELVRELGEHGCPFSVMRSGCPSSLDLAFDDLDR